MIVLKTTKGARTFEDEIMEIQVPELVYLQTRKLKRNEHFKRVEERQARLSELSAAGDADSEEDNDDFSAPFFG